MPHTPCMAQSCAFSCTGPFPTPRKASIKGVMAALCTVPMCTNVLHCVGKQYRHDHFPCFTAACQQPSHLSFHKPAGLCYIILHHHSTPLHLNTCLLSICACCLPASRQKGSDCLLSICACCLPASRQKGSDCLLLVHTSPDNKQFRRPTAWPASSKLTHL